MIMMMIAPNSLARQKERVQGEGEEESGRSNEGRPNKNSDASHGRSHRSLLVRGVGCEAYEKTWTRVWGSILQEGQRGLGISPIYSHDRN